MNFLPHHALRCPLDQHRLLQEANRLVCEAGHSFDIAKQGYVNMLAAHDKRSRDPGDAREMIAARRSFLERGYYQPIADQLNRMVQPLLFGELSSEEVLSGESSPGEWAAALLPGESLSAGLLVVDAGCGEGYYLDQLARELATAGKPPVSMLGFDISKWAMRAAARRFPATWLVASNRQIPLAAQSADIVLSLFGFPDYPAFHRILKPGGSLLVVNPGPKHLLELRQIIYSEIKQKPPVQGDAAVDAGFSRAARQGLEFEINAMEQGAIAELLAMTPHMFRANSAGKHRASQLSELSLTVDVQFELLSADCQETAK